MLGADGRPIGESLKMMGHVTWANLSNKWDRGFDLTTPNI